MPVNIQFRRVWEEVEQDRPRNRTLEYVQRRKSHDDVMKALVTAVCGVAITVVLALLAFAVLERIFDRIRKTSEIPLPLPAPERLVSPQPPKPCITSVSPVTVDYRPVETWTYETKEPITCDGWREQTPSDVPSVQADWPLPTSTPAHTQSARRKPGGTYAYAWPSREGESTPTYWNPRVGAPSRRRSR